MAVAREMIVNLYRNLIRESKKWDSYNYRMYALRKIRHEFRENKLLQDAEKIKESYNYGLTNLDMIRRQVTIGNLYSTRQLVIETTPTQKAL
ncbi:LYR motif-containing protein 4 [Neodiprion pinetum]|uniref:LYR motif-containing protein 4 n=1 Tax=Neodiprion lecontei TaxID=441921 RepID=A0A6J0C4D9_NEOLC|nr:LYR motif-containing protein 4 [Neodiprion lecontei]XP_046415808.1 LYR motif-containing protein 4 [Neodiprion fabricii]XP_046475013.1 LYR motif-containing protein 4 [Neodiprion pinetum]XP_046611990.1 LYR motif-containing protein 4 [Neodiprion virginianus]